MATSVTCSCGKQYAWKPELVGKRARCKCGKAIFFPYRPPEPPAELALEPTIEDEAPSPPPYAPPAVTTAERTRPAPASSELPASSAPPMLTRIGVLAGGLALLGVFAVWPMMQVSRGEESVSISFKGIVLAAMLTVVGLNLVFLGDKGIPWKKTSDAPLTLVQKAVIFATAATGLLLAGLIWLYFSQMGYTVRF